MATVRGVLPGACAASLRVYTPVVAGVTSGACCRPTAGSAADERAPWGENGPATAKAVASGGGDGGGGGGGGGSDGGQRGRSAPPTTRRRWWQQRAREGGGAATHGRCFDVNVGLGKARWGGGAHPSTVFDSRFNRRPSQLSSTIGASGQKIAKNCSSICHVWKDVSYGASRHSYTRTRSDEILTKDWEARCTEWGARTPDHQIKSLALYRLS